MLKIAITGNIASGKSQVESMLSKSYPVYDTDKMAHEILDKLDGFYSYDVLTDGKIDRKKLGELVFINKEARKQLEAFIHPIVKERVLKIFDEHKDDKAVFVSVPLLFEAGFDNLFDIIVLVTTDENIRIKRLMARNGMSRDEAVRRIRAQVHENKKIPKADFVISNNSTMENLTARVEDFRKNLGL